MAKPTAGREPAPFAGVRVIELGTLPAAAYCARLLADFGADVIKVEAPQGDPARRALPVFDIGADRRESAFFAFLNANKRSIAATEDGLAALVAGADVLVDGTIGSARPAAGIDHAELARAHPHLVIADVSWFGASGPYRDFRGTDAVCRALAGLVKLVGPVEGPPLTLPDYQAGIIGGLSAFIALVAALMARVDGARGRYFEVSVHEAAAALSELDISRLVPGYEERRAGVNLFTSGGTLGIFACKAGRIGVTCNSPAQWRALCALLEMPQLGDHPDYANAVARAKRAAELGSLLAARFEQRSAHEWLQDALRLKLPIAIVPDMAELLAQPVWAQRGSFVELRAGSRTVRAPGCPLRLTRTPPSAGGVVPRPAEHDALAAASRERSPFAPVRIDVAPPALPLAGTRIIDLSMGWAGPIATRMLGDLGADIIKVEAVRYPDWWRGQERHAAVYEQMLYEKSSRFNLLNRNKRGITLDLTAPEGVDLLKRLVALADGMIENNSAGVLPKLGLDYARLVAVNPSLVMVSMNAFGANNAWSDLRAYGSTLEHGSGLPSVSGRAQDPPVQNHVAYGDAVSGLNACAALLTALLHRKRTGAGQFIDLSQVECMLSLAAPWVIEQSANGGIGPRAGNRHPMHAPQGIYRCEGADEWVLVAVTDDAMWRALCAVMRLDAFARDPELAHADGRRARHDEIDARVEAWTSRRTKADAMLELQRAGVAAGAVLSPGELLSDAHLAVRGFWQSVRREHVGEQPQASAPFREQGVPFAVRSPAPTLGEHNTEVLGRLLGLSASELEALAARGVIGTRALPPLPRGKAPQAGPA
ncbi:MAG: CoA transferase [Burkholderiales bacterium]|nr:CoA transferase [Burkholderiales bacterium]